jgi:hypothetical protein
VSPEDRSSDKDEEKFLPPKLLLELFQTHKRSTYLKKGEKKDYGKKRRSEESKIDLPKRHPNSLRNSAP